MGLYSYSFLIGAVVLWLGSAIALSRFTTLAIWLRLGLLAILAGLFFALWQAIRPTDSPNLSTPGDLTAQIGQGKPVVLEFYSEY